MARRFFPVAASFLALGLLAGCGAPPRYKAKLDRLEASPPRQERSYAGRLPFARLPLEVGQWVEYLGRSEEGGPFLLRQEVVGREGGAFWVQQTHTTYWEQTTLKLLMDGLASANPKGVEVLKVLHGDPRGKVKDVSDLASELKELLAAVLPQKVTGDRGITVTVPAGTFSNTVLQRVGVDGPHQWFHSEVPIWGIVRTRILEEGEIWELLDFGLTGARDAFAPR